MRIFITGGTGFIGRHLIARLASYGHELTVLTRQALTSGHGVTVIQGDPVKPGRWQEALAGQDAVINLAGEPLSARWTASRKQRIFTSRIETTRNLVAAMLAAQLRPSQLIQASGIGYYGVEGDAWFTENSPAGGTFLAEVSRRWEAACEPAEAAGIRIVRLRIGLVLGRDGGALPRMMPPFRWGIGAPLGHGRQYYSWIHIEDLVRLVVFCLDHPVWGPVNAVAPQPLAMRDFGRTLAQVMLRPFWPVPVPAFLLRMVLGEMATVVLEGQRVRPQRAVEAGFTFRYPELEPALRALVLG